MFARIRHLVSHSERSLQREEIFVRSLQFGSTSLRFIGKNLYSSSYESLMAKIVATFICLCFALIGRTDLRAAAAKPRVVIAHAAMNFRVAPLWVAQDQGFFSKYGIESEVIYMRGGPTLLSGMLSVDIQVGWTASGITRRYQRALTSLSSPDSTTGSPTN